MRIENYEWLGCAACFVFEDFLPAKSSARRERLGGLASETRTLVFYESSRRIDESLADMRLVFGDERMGGDRARPKVDLTTFRPSL